MILHYPPIDYNLFLLIAIINGIGGIGKTVIAKSLFHSLERNFDYVAWIQYNGNLRQSILSSFYFTQNKNSEVRKWSQIEQLLNTPKTKLLIVDDVTNSTKDDPFLKQITGSNARIILTSRLKTISPYHSYKIHSLSVEECTLLFQNYCEPSLIGAEDNSIIQKYIELVKGHTLSIELLAKSIDPMLSLSEFYSKLLERGFGYSELEIETDHTDISLSLAQHLHILYDLAQISIEQQKILINMALMPDMDIPAEIRNWIKCSVNDLQKLVSSGWLELADHAYYMHPIIRQTILLDANVFSQDLYSDYLTCLAFHQYILQNESFSSVLPKLAIAQCYLSSMSTSDEITLAVAKAGIARFCMIYGKYADAEDYYRSAIVVLEQVHDLCPKTIAGCYSDLACTLKDLGKYREAISFHRQAINQWQLIQGKDQQYIISNIATAYGNLSITYIAANLLKKAEEANQQALEHYMSLDECQIGLAHCYCNYAAISCRKGKYKEAEEWFIKAIHSGTFDQEQLFLATVYNDLADVYYRMKETSLEIEYNLKALAIRESILGSEHPQTIESYSNIALAYERAHDYDNAFKYINKAVLFFQKHSEYDCLEKAAVFNNIAVIYDACGMYDKALNFYELSLDINKRIRGLWNPATALNYNNYALVIEKKGRINEALDYFSLGYYIDKNILGTQHHECQMIFINMVQCFITYNNSYGEFLQWYLDKEEQYSKTIFHPGFIAERTNELSRAQLAQICNNKTC